MRLLVDTQSVIWAVDDPTKLSPTVAAALQDPGNDLFVSAATIWEISIKVGLGKLTLSSPYRDSALPQHHKDPFDRLCIAQALTDGFGVVSSDAQFDKYGVTRVW